MASGVTSPPPSGAHGGPRERHHPLDPACPPCPPRRLSSPPPAGNGRRKRP
jgi:hypothetical protein